MIGLLMSEDTDTEEKNFPNTFSLLVWWSITSIIAFSYAGERMPWLTYHMAWPMILITGWALGRIIDTTELGKIKRTAHSTDTCRSCNIYRRRHGNDPCPRRIHSPISGKGTGAVTSHQHLPPAIGRNHPKRSRRHLSLSEMDISRDQARIRPGILRISGRADSTRRIPRLLHHLRSGD